MKLFKREIVVFLKLWLMMLLTYVVATLAFDLVYYGWVDLRQAALARLLYLPIALAAVFQLLTWPKRRAAGGAKTD